METREREVIIQRTNSSASSNWVWEIPSMSIVVVWLRFARAHGWIALFKVAIWGLNLQFGARGNYYNLKA